MHEMLSFQDLTYRCEYGERVHEGGRKGPDPDSDVVSGVPLLHVGDNICIGKWKLVAEMTVNESKEKLFAKNRYFAPPLWSAFCSCKQNCYRVPY